MRVVRTGGRVGRLDSSCGSSCGAGSGILLCQVLEEVLHVALVLVPGPARRGWRGGLSHSGGWWVGHGGVGEVGSAVFCPLLVHPLLECGVDHGGLGREAERVYLSVQQCAN